MAKTLLVAAGIAAAVLLAVLFLARDMLLRRGSTVDCPEGPRRTIDMRAFQTRYSAYSVSFEAKLSDKGELSGKVDPVQLTQLSESAQQAAEFRKFLVAGYNSCAVSSQQFAAAGTRFQTLDGLARQIDTLAKKSTLAAAEQTQLSALVAEYVRNAAKLGGN
jgi:hypothetical protein